MKGTSVWAAVALPLVAASATLVAAPSAHAAPTTDSIVTSGELAAQGRFTCKEYGRAGVTKARTPVHAGPSGDAAVTGYIDAGRTVHEYYQCINSAGNIWYEITGYLDTDAGESRARFIWDGYL